MNHCKNDCIIKGTPEKCSIMKKEHNKYPRPIDTPWFMAASCSSCNVGISVKIGHDVKLTEKDFEGHYCTDCGGEFMPLGGRITNQTKIEGWL